MPFGTNKCYEVRVLKMTKGNSDFLKERLSHLSEGYRIEGDGRRGFLRLSVIGVIGITELDGGTVRLFTQREAMEIKGERLTVSVFENKVLEISGNIRDLHFLFGKESKG